MSQAKEKKGHFHILGPSLSSLETVAKTSKWRGRKSHSLLVWMCTVQPPLEVLPYALPYLKGIESGLTSNNTTCKLSLPALECLVLVPEWLPAAATRSMNTAQRSRMKRTGRSSTSKADSWTRDLTKHLMARHLKHDRGGGGGAGAALLCC